MVQVKLSTGCKVMAYPIGDENMGRDLYPGEVLKIPPFVYGGKAEFSIENLKSGRGFKYRVVKVEDNKKDYVDKFFVYVDGEYAGLLSVYSAGKLYWSQGKKGTLSENSPAIKGLYMALDCYDGMPRPMVLYHYGKCSVCGRKLTDPKSIGYGVGPECRKKFSGWYSE